MPTLVGERPVFPGRTKAIEVKTLFFWLLLSTLSLNLPVVAAQAADDPAADGDSEAARRSSVRAAILRHFPDLNANVLAGWVDAYVDVPAAELEVLLEQRQQLPQIAPLHRLMTPFDAQPSSLPEISASKTQSVSSAEEMRSLLKQNLLHLQTPGHRRRVVRTELDELTAEATAHSMRLSAPEFDFADGAVVPSANALHVAIVQPQAAMFLLHSATNPEMRLLTRNGRFQRLNEGRIGLKSGSTSLVLSEEVRIPEAAERVRIAANGQVTWQNAAGEAVSGGRISLAVVHDPGCLQSQNGVYFRLPADAAAGLVTMTSDVMLRPQSVELSNTVPETEIRMLEYLQTLE
jgi:flagellar basal body rod protein FlgG